MENIVAKITIDSNTKRITNVNLFNHQLTFRCRRCATFCCKLGAPKLLQEDIEQLEQAGYKEASFLDDNSRITSKADGSCIFLSSDETSGLHECAIYAMRPALCKLYPFQLEKAGQNLYTLGLIPYCNGLNVKDGESVDAKFVTTIVASVLYQLIGSGIV